MSEAERFHYRTDDAVVVTVADPAGQAIPNTVTVVAGLGSAYRPPAENLLVSCPWADNVPAAERDFTLRVRPATAPVVAPGAYRVWFRLSGAGVSPLSPLIKADTTVVIYGGP